MSKKVVLITGASSGIGKSIAEYLLDKGYKVYGTSRNPSKYPQSKVNLLSLDVNNIHTIQSVVNDIVRLEGRIDVLINNAGVGIVGAIEETPIDQMKHNFDTNFFGPVQMIQQVLPSMRKNKSGLIINITSIAGYMGLPYRGIYSASKGALELLTEALRMEVDQFGVTVTNIAPGDFATNIAQGRYHVPLQEKSEYYATYQAILTLINEHVNDGGDTIEMAKAVHKVINTKEPKIHYKVGSFLQKVSTVLKKILPDKMYEKMLKKHYKIDV
ncbi:MAG: SDR family oxidoreductase [Bacteroidota bacterium]|nr:SDR family oxidoreductase [Bacteroidota bacterium]